MAEVFLATDGVLARPVALKVLRTRFADDAAFVERFQREARAAAALNHPNVVAIHDRVGADGTSFIVMEYVPGEALEQLIARRGRLAPADACRVERGLLAALQAAHEHGIVHRDVTAHNVLLAPDGRVKVADFGIARFGSSELTATGVVMGTSRYLSPEQARGEPADARSDLYSAGVVLFEMLSGRLPFDGDSDVAIALRHATEPPAAPSELVPGLPPALDAIVARALAKDPAARFQTARDFTRALDGLQLGAGSPVALDERAAPGGPVASPAAASEALVKASAPATRVASGTALTVVAAPGVTAATRVAAARVRPRRRRRLVLLVVALGLVAAGAAGALVYRGLADRAHPLPSVVGLSRAPAVAALRHKGFVVGLSSGLSDMHPRGTVMAERPAAGTPLQKGAAVQLVVSRGLLHPPVPGVVDLSAGAAAAALRAAGFVPWRLSRHSTTVPSGRVVAQSPATATSLLRGSTVRYWVSSGPAKVVVPDVVGASGDSAAAALRHAGFSVQVHDTLGLGTFPGDVVRQRPSAGTLVARGAGVAIWVAAL